MQSISSPGKGKLEFTDFVKTFVKLPTDIPDVKTLRKTFNIIDKSGDDSLSRDELKIGLIANGIHLSDEGVSSVFQIMDRNGDGRVGFKGTEACHF